MPPRKINNENIFPSTPLRQNSTSAIISETRSPAIIQIIPPSLGPQLYLISTSASASNSRSYNRKHRTQSLATVLRGCAKPTPGKIRAWRANFDRQRRNYSPGVGTRASVRFPKIGAQQRTERNRRGRAAAASFDLSKGWREMPIAHRQTSRKVRTTTTTITATTTRARREKLERQCLPNDSSRPISACYPTWRYWHSFTTVRFRVLYIGTPRSCTSV